MVHKSLEPLKLDQRLIRRRGWIPESELAEQLEALPDASAKIDPREDEPEEARGEGAEPGAGTP